MRSTYIDSSIGVSDTAKQELKQAIAEAENEPIEPTNYAVVGKVEEEDEAKPMKTWQIVVFFILGAAGIAGGAELLVLGGENLARLAGMSETFIGLTIIGIGTSLPELVTTISSIRRKAGSIGIGNIVGANVLNIGLLVGLASCISGSEGLSVDMLTMAISIPVAIVLCLLIAIPLMAKKESFRWQGITLISIYVVYLTFLILNAIFGYVA